MVENFKYLIVTIMCLQTEVSPGRTVCKIGRRNSET